MFSLLFAETGWGPFRWLAEKIREVLAQPAETLGRAAQPCDLLLLDPPYGSGLAGPALVRAVEQGWVAPHAMVSIETGKGEAVLIPGFTAATPRAHGKAWLHLLRADG